MKVGAPRGALRQGLQSYGMQQARNLRNARKRDEGTLNDAPREHLFVSLRSLQNKNWVRPVTAAAVIPAVQVVPTYIGLKESVAGQLSSL